MKFINNISKSIAGAALMLMAASCSPDDHNEINPALRQSASDIQVDINVNQENDTVTFTLLNKGCNPVWYFSDGTKSTVNGVKKGFLVEGTYEVEIRMYDKNGITEGSVIKQFTINKTLLSTATQESMLASEDGKVWTIAADKAGHLGCGPSADKPTEWYGAGKNEKEGKGLYDDKFIFYSNGKYVYNPGEGGDAYVNVGSTVLGTAPDKEDFTVTGLSEKSGSWKFEYRGTDLYLVLSPEMLLGYLPYDELYTKPEFLVTSIAGKKLTLVANKPDGSISWQYILGMPAEDNGNTGDKPANTGYVYDHSCNMWKNTDIELETYYNPGWAGEMSTNSLEKVSNQKFIAKIPTATSETWQAQNKLHTLLSANSQNNYDFSLKLNSNLDHGNVTVKLTQDGNDGNFFFTETVKISGGEETVFMMTDMKGIDADKLMLVIDFGGNPENFECEITDIVFKEHGCDDGTVIVPETPADDPGASMNWDYSADGNLFKVDFKEPAPYYNPGWSGELSTWSFTSGSNNSYTVTWPTGCGAQWQAQFPLDPATPVSTSADKKYDFHIVLNSTTDCPKVTVKLVKVGDDNTFYTADQHDIEAGEDVAVNFVGMNGIDGDFKIVLDFGFCPENTTVEIKDIILQESAL